MAHGHKHRILQLLFFGYMCNFVSTENTTKQIIKIGGIFTDESYDLTGHRAFRVAISYVNQLDNILPNITLMTFDGTKSTNDQSGSTGSLEILRRACNVVQEGVAAVIGPATTNDVRVVSPVFSGLHIPHVSPFSTDPTLSTSNQNNDYLIKMSAPDTYQSAAILDLIEHFSWGRFAIIAEDTDYGRNGMIPLQTLAALNYLTITSVTYFNPANVAAEVVKPTLNEIWHKGTRVVVLNCLAESARIILDQAYMEGMLQQGWAWITTDGVTLLNDLYKRELDVPVHLRGLLGTRPLSATGRLYPQFSTIWNNGTKSSDEFYAMKVFDAVMAMAYGLHDYLEADHVLEDPVFGDHVCMGDANSPWPQGELLAQYIMQASGDGAAHYLNFTNYHYPDTTDYEIVNLRKTGWKKVGSWSKEIELEEPILFSGGTGNYPLDTATTLKNVTIRVTTIIEEPFTMYDAEAGFTGYCIDFLNELQENLGFNYELMIVKDGSYGIENPETRKWNGMVAELLNDDTDLILAPLTITYEREKVIDFTKPYLDLGNTILMAKEMPRQTYGAFLDPFSWQLWVAVAIAFVFSGICNTLVSWLSPLGNRGYYSSRLDPDSRTGEEDKNTFNLWNSLWFALGQWMMQGAESSPRCFSGRVVYGAWYMAVMIISATYTANLAAFLTVQRLDDGINSIEDLANQKEISYGAVSHTATAEFFRIQVSEPYVTMHKFMEERNTYINSSTMGVRMVQDSYGKPKAERFALMGDSVPLDYAAHQPPCHTNVVGRLFNQFGYGLALQKNSPFKQIINLEVLKLRQNGFLNRLQTKWILAGTCTAEESTNDGHGEKQATLMQMFGVFFLMIAIMGLGFIIIIFEYCAAAKKDHRISSQNKGAPMTFCSALNRRWAAVSSDIRGNIFTFIGSRSNCRDDDNISEVRPDAKTRSSYDDHVSASSTITCEVDETKQELCYSKLDEKKIIVPGVTNLGFSSAESNEGRLSNASKDNDFVTKFFSVKT